MTFPLQCAETPAGKLLAPVVPSFDIPVAPVVEIVMLVKAVLIQRVGDVDGLPAVFTFTVKVAVPSDVAVPTVPVTTQR